MKSEFAQFLTDLQNTASEEDVIIEAQHFDVLDYYFKAKQSVEEAYQNYLKFRIRWYAINDIKFPTVKINHGKTII